MEQTTSLRVGRRRTRFDCRRLSRLLPHDARQRTTWPYTHPLASVSCTYDDGSSDSRAEGRHGAVLRRRTWRVQGRLGIRRGRRHQTRRPFLDTGTLRLGRRDWDHMLFGSAGDSGRHPPHPTNDRIARDDTCNDRLLDPRLPGGRIVRSAGKRYAHGAVVFATGPKTKGNANSLSATAMNNPLAIPL